MILSTAHKSKGREWDAVKLADDFPAEPKDEELRLLYVACTRAKLHLDISAIDHLTQGAQPAVETIFGLPVHLDETVEPGDVWIRNEVLINDRWGSTPGSVIIDRILRDQRRAIRLEVLHDLLTYTDAGIELDSAALREIIEEVEAATDPVDEAGPMQGHHARAALEQIQARAAHTDPGQEPRADHTGEGEDHPRSGLGAIRPTAESHRPAPDDTPSAD